VFDFVLHCNLFQKDKTVSRVGDNQGDWDVWKKWVAGGQEDFLRGAGSKRRRPFRRGGGGEVSLGRAPEEQKVNRGTNIRVSGCRSWGPTAGVGLESQERRVEQGEGKLGLLAFEASVPEGPADLVTRGKHRVP